MPRQYLEKLNPKKKLLHPERMEKWEVGQKLKNNHIKFRCRVCNGLFSTQKSMARYRKSCSSQCHSVWMKKCKWSYWTGKKRYPATIEKMRLASTGKKNSRWCGGRVVDPNGYIRLRFTNITILEHRFLMERFLGRPLTKIEDVHHLNGVRHDNRMKNLIVLDEHDHMIYHNKNRKKET